MNIRSIVNIKLDKLYAEREDNKETLQITEEIAKLENLEKFLGTIKDKISKDKSFVKDLDLDKIIDVICKYNNNLNLDIETYKSQMHTIQIVLKGIYDRNFKMSLVPEQEMLLNTFYKQVEDTYEIIFDKLTELDKKITDINVRKSVIDEEILAYEIFLENVYDKKEPIVEKDKPLIDDIINDSSIPYEDRKNLLIQIDKYNTSLINQDEVGLVKTDISEFMKVLIGFGLYEEEINKDLHDYAEEVCLNGNVDNFKQILGFLKSKNIINKFDFKDLLVILTYGTLESVKNCYNFLTERGYSYEVYCDTPSAWINNQSHKGYVPRKPVPNGNRGKKTPLHDSAHVISMRDMDKNITFLKSVNINISALTDRGYKRVKITPNELLETNYDICGLYGLTNVKGKELAVSTLSVANLASKIDSCIELGLGDYVKRYSSATTFTTSDFCAYLYALKRNHSEEEYRKLVFKEWGTNTVLNGELRKNIKRANLDSEEKVNAYLKENDLYSYQFKEQASMEEYLKSDFIYQIDESIFEDEKIKSLDREFQVDEYTYNFNGQLISRMKVLRLYSSLKDEFSNNDELLLYVITHNSLIDTEHFNYIANAIGCNLTNKEANNELSKRS